jgi:cobalt transporter subunit CbtA
LSLTAGVAGRTARSPFSRIVSTAVAAGLLAGLLLTAVQTVQITPIILQAEVHEDAAAAAPVAHVHADGHEHQHEHAGWKPENGTERTLFTVLANASMGVGYGLLLCAALTVAGRRPTLRQGVMWGAASYMVFFVAPSLGLPPELPGSAVAPLRERQLWWALTALSTAGGLALLATGRGWVRAVAGFVLLAAPQLIGAPQPLVHASAAPAGLAHAFVVASALANAAFWLALGGLTAFFFKKFE